MYCTLPSNPIPPQPTRDDFNTPHPSLLDPTHPAGVVLGILMVVWGVSMDRLISAIIVTTLARGRNKQAGKLHVQLIHINILTHLTNVLQTSIMRSFSASTSDYHDPLVG